MKKLIILPILILAVGCTNKEKIFEEYAVKYYNNHMKIVNNVNEAVVTLEDLKNASTEDEYNLDKLNKCENQSKVTLTINKETKEITNKKIDLKC